MQSGQTKSLLCDSASIVYFLTGSLHESICHWIGPDSGLGLSCTNVCTSLGKRTYISSIWKNARQKHSVFFFCFDKYLQNAIYFKNQWLGNPQNKQQLSLTH